MKHSERIETRAVHAGEPSPRIGGAVVMPLFQSAMYETAGSIRNGALVWALVRLPGELRVAGTDDVVRPFILCGEKITVVPGALTRVALPRVTRSLCNFGQD